jgi:predicted NACHT family NTPase
MMLYIAIKVAMGRKDKSGDLLPSTRSELYEAFISTLFNHHEEKGKHLRADRIQIENALTDLYFNLQCRNEVSCKYFEALKFVKESSEDPMFRKISPQVILEECFKLGLLSKNGYHVSYEIHQSFQEYFAAIKLKELFESGYDVSEAFSHPKWEEVVIFTSEMLVSVDEFIELMISKKELYLASKCTNKASDEIKEKLCALLADEIDSGYRLEKINSIKSLGRIGNTGGSNTAMQLLINALKDEDSDVRRNAAYALGKICTVKNKKQLEELLESEHEFSVNTAYKILYEIEKEERSKAILFKDEEFLKS